MNIEVLMDSNDIIINDDSIIIDNYYYYYWPMINWMMTNYY